MLCAAGDPEHVIWRSDEPIATYTTREKDEPHTLGAVVYEQDIVVYFTTNADKFVTVHMPNPYAPSR